MIFPSPEHRTILLTQLRTLGIKTVQVDFSGGGDSGDIDSAIALDAGGNHIDINKHVLDWPENSSRHDPDTNSWITDTKIKAQPLDKILEQVTLDALDEAGMDWYNNDGGQGTLTIDFNRSPPEIDLELGINHTATTDYSFSFNEENEDAPMSP
jgi:hypothetical protein